MKITRIVAAALATTILAVLAGGPAWAHNSLVEAVPKKDAKLSEAPEEIRLTFLQKPDARFMTIVVTDAQQRKVATAAPKADGKTGTVALTEALPDGAYTVAYRVVSQDGHPVQGSYTFTVDNPVAEAPSVAPAPVQTQVTASAPAIVPVALDDEGPGWWPIAAAAAGVMLLGAAAVFVVRRARS